MNAEIQNHQFLVKIARNSRNLKLFMSIRFLPNFTWTAAQLRGRRELKAHARLLAASSNKTSKNQPTTHPILTQTTEKTSIQQVSASLTYGSNSGQEFLTPQAWQLKTHTPAARILTEFFTGQTKPRPRTRSRDPKTPTNHRALP